MPRVWSKGHEKPFCIISMIPIVFFLVVAAVLLYKFQVSLLASIVILLLMSFFSYFRMRRCFDHVVLEKNMIYTPRAGWFHWREIKRAYIKEVPGLIFGNQKCIFFELCSGPDQTPFLYEHWRMYLISTKKVAICESESKVSLSQLLEQIKAHLG